MPAYDYRCNSCGQPFSLFYKTYKAYDDAAADRACPHCGSAQIVRVFDSVMVQTPGDRDFSRMSSNEMLSVLESGKSNEVAQLYQQTGGDQALSDPKMRKAAKKAGKTDTT